MGPKWPLAVGACQRLAPFVGAAGVCVLFSWIIIPILWPEPISNFNISKQMGFPTRADLNAVVLLVSPPFYLVWQTRHQEGGCQMYEKVASTGGVDDKP